MRSNEIFEEIKKTVEAGGEELVKKVKGIFLFKITDSSGKETQWIVDLKNGRGSVKNTPGKGDVTIKVKDNDFMDMASGKLSPQKAFFSGKLKLAGNTAMAMKLQNIMPKPEGAKL